MPTQVVTTSGGGLRSAGGLGPESFSLDEAAAQQLGTPTGMLRALSVATPTPDSR